MTAELHRAIAYRQQTYCQLILLPASLLPLPLLNQDLGYIWADDQKALPLFALLLAFESSRLLEPLPQSD